MKNRTVKNLLYADIFDMGGMPVRQAFPTLKVEQVDPFLLIHHADIKVPMHLKPRHGGVGPHPHRGFSPVTFIFKGGVHHRDSRGNSSVVYAGGAQWMNAGMGVMHSERPPDDIHDLGGRQEIIQLWINSPARHKMDRPEYFPVQKNEIPAYKSPDELATINIIAGELLGIKGPVPAKTPVNAATLELKKGARIAIPLPAHHNSFIYAHEKVVSHGPFVMNNETEILEAMRDYQKGRMGILIEE
jgi:quercetin 2,3-dioxygenase